MDEKKICFEIEGPLYAGNPEKEAEVAFQRETTSSVGSSLKNVTSKKFSIRNHLRNSNSSKVK